MSPVQHFEADFLWKVSLKILNSGLTLNTITYANYVSNLQDGYKTDDLKFKF